MKFKLFAIPSVAVSVIVIASFVFFYFRDTQQNLFYFLELALPFLFFIGLFYLLAFKLLGQSQLDNKLSSVKKVLSSATLVAGILSLTIFVIFLFLPAPPLNAVGSKPTAGKALQGIFLSVFIPIWSAYMAGGLVQYLLIRKYSS